MNKTYLVVKTFYSDFDVPKSEVLGASENEATVDIVVAKYNAKRTAQEIKDEVEFEKQTVKMLR